MENNILIDKQEYYTPEIEDLFIGYEYEFNNGGEWEKSEILPRDFSTETPGFEPLKIGLKKYIIN